MVAWRTRPATATSLLVVDDACRANGTGGSLAAARSRANDAGVTQAASRALLA